MKNRQREFDKWFENNNYPSWNKQMKKLEELYPLKNWKIIWKCFNTWNNHAKSYLLYNKPTTAWKIQWKQLKFLIETIGVE